MQKEIVFVNNTFRAYSLIVNTEYHLQLNNYDGSVTGIPMPEFIKSLTASINPSISSELNIEYKDNGDVVMRYHDREWVLSHKEWFELNQTITGDVFKPEVEGLPSKHIATLFLLTLSKILSS